MKRLIVALVAAVAFSTAFARLTDTQSFEGSFSDFVPSIVDEDASEVVAYDNDEPAFPAPYDFADFGSKYLSLDTGDATLWRTNAGDAAYFDMAMQFNPCASAPEIDEDTKIAVYLNSSSNLVVLAGDGAGGTATNVMTGTTLNPGTWARLTIASVTDGFKVTLNTNTVVGTFASRTSDTTIKSVGFKGTGALDDFVARTTDPFIQNPAVQIGGEGYASIADALTDAGASSVIELLANNADAVTLGSGESLKLKLGEYDYTGTITLPDGYVLGTPTTADGVTTYAQVEGVAQVQGDDNDWKWFGSFAEAFAYARAQTQYQPNMKFKVGSDFTPDISSNLSVQNLEFIAATEDPIIINLANGNAKLVAFNIKFPTTATLNAVSGNVNSMKGGTLNVPSGVVLELASYAADGSSWKIAGLTGSGTIKNDGKNLYRFIGNPGYNLPTCMRDSSWCGTLELCGSNTWDAEFNRFANANSKVCFNGLTTPLWGSGNDSVAIELVGDGLTITNGTGSATTFNIGGKVAGSGSLTFANIGSQLCTYNFTGDFSEFAGSVSFDETANAVIVFGSGDKTVELAKSIEVLSGASASVGSGATWLASNLTVGGTLGVAGTLTATNTATVNSGAAVNVTGALITSSATPTVNNGASITIADGGSWTIPNGGAIVHGNLTAAGNVRDTANGVGKIYTNQGTAVLTANAAGAFKIGSDDFKGTYVVNFDNADANTAFAIPQNNVAVTTVVNGVNEEFHGYPTKVAGSYPDYKGTIVLNADWTVGNGWSQDGQVTKIATLSGSGDLIVDGTDSQQSKNSKLRYNIATLHNYTGTLGGILGNFTIGTVNVATAPVAMTNIVKTAIGAAGAILSTNVPYTVNNGAASENQKLVYCASGMSDGEGYYLAVAKVGDDYYATLAGAADAATTAGAESFVKLADTTEAIPGDWKYDSSTGTYVQKVYVAQVGEKKYESLKEAVDAATPGQTVAVIANCTVAEPITFNYGITVSNDYTVSVTASYALRIFNGTASPVTFCGAGTYLCTGTGSPFLVGNNEETAKASDYGISGTYAGSMVLESGTLKIPGTSNNLVKVENGTFVMNGGEILGGSRGIKADADAGNFTSTVTINGGVISNAVNKTAVAATAATGTSTVTINGGDFTGLISKSGANATLTIPGLVNESLNTAKFNADSSTFCEAGYGTKQSGDWYVVAPKYAITFISGEGSTTNDYAIFDGDAVDAPEPAAVVGKKFTGWNPAVVSPAAGNATYTAQYEAIAYVAEIGETKYETLAAAVAAAAASGDTIALLGNITLDERITLSKSLTLDLGGYTIARTAAPDNDNGSAFRVDGSYAVVITNGTIDCSQVDDSTVVGDGVYAIDVKNGGSLTLDSLTIAVNSQAGACVYPWTGSSVTILGGTYRNDTAVDYQHHAGWRGMAVNQANVATQLITIYGGSFKQVNPALGDDSWAENAGTFLASGKATTFNGSTGYWDVGDAATPVEPGQKDETKYDDAEAATNAAASVTIAIPAEVASKLSVEQKADYADMFETKVVANGDGTYSVAVEMKDEVVAEVQGDVDDATVDTLTEVLKVDAGNDAEVTVATKPGLYYAIVIGDSLPLAAPESDAYVMATAGSTSISVRKPSGNEAFFKVYCSETK